MGRPLWIQGAGWALILAGGALVLAALLQGTARPSAPAHPPPEPLIPTRTPTLPALEEAPPAPAASPSPTLAAPSVDPMPPPTSTPTRLGGGTGRSGDAPSTSVPRPSPTASMGASPSHSPAPDASYLLYRGRPRWGVGVPIGPISKYPIAPLRLGWYLDWRARPDPPQPGGVEYVQMVRLRDGALRPDAEAIAAIARANPGSLWLIGNEPDVKWQDSVEPAVYARLYHEAYWAIKGADPTAQVAIGGVAQPTPLRLRYLDMVLEAYRAQFGAEMPVDVWNVHNFLLREERGSWGVDIPPGLPDRRGVLYEVDDSGNLEAFRRQIWDFRRWMATRGFRGRPLIVSEYGIPMPEDYGFPPERVVAFLRATFEFFLTAADPALGDPTDGGRLVQRWCWYSLDDITYPTGNLFDPQTGALTAVGEGWVKYIEELYGR